MDEQHYYEIQLKKDELQIHLSSDDVYFISKQMDKWFRILLDDSYVPVSPPQPSSTPPSVPAPEVAQPASESVALPPAEPVVVQNPEPPAPTPAPVEVSPSPVVETPGVATSEPNANPEPISAEAEPSTPLPAPPQVVLPEQEVTQTASPALSNPEVVLSEPVEALSANDGGAVPEAAVAANPSQSDDFEAVLDTVIRDLETTPPAPAVNANFLEDAEMPLDLIGSLTDLCEQVQPTSAEDYLLIGAFYLARVEGLSAFSLKRINSSLVKSGYTPVNHSVLETVLSKGYLAMVPDLTGTGEVTEYVLTPEGSQRIEPLLQA